MLVMTVLIGTAEVFGYASTEQAVNTAVQSAVAIEKTSERVTGSINPATGSIIGELMSSFNIQTNETNSYDFIVYSKVLTADGEVSAFDSSGNLLFGNTDVLPSATAVANAKNANADNPNVIGYRFNVEVGNDMTKEFTNSATYDECYKVNFINNAVQGPLRQSISGQPAANTYSIGQDIAGNYKATVYITAVSK